MILKIEGYGKLLPTIVLLLLLVVSCGKNKESKKEQPREVTVYDKNGKKMRVMEYNKAGKVVQVSFYKNDSTVSHRSTYEYDNKDRLVKSRNNRLNTTLTYKYDDQDRLIEKDFNGTDKAYKEKYTYDDLGKTKTYYHSGLKRKIIQFLNAEGNPYKAVTFDQTGDTLAIARYEYDSRGNEVSYENREIKSDFYEKKKTIYNAQNNKTEEIIYNKDGSEKSHDWYEYDEQGRLIRTHGTENDMPLYEGFREYIGDTIFYYQIRSGHKMLWREEIIEYY